MPGYRAERRVRTRNLVRAVRMAATDVADVILRARESVWSLRLATATPIEILFLRIHIGSAHQIDDMAQHVALSSCAAVPSRSAARPGDP